MANFNISNTEVGDTRPTSLDTVITPLYTKGATGDDETVADNSKWATYWGAFN